MGKNIVFKEFLELIENKKIYLEESVKEHIIKNTNEKLNLRTKKNLVDTPLRGEVIITQDIEKSKNKINEIVELYQFLIEDDGEKVWREELPVQREFMDLKDLKCN